MDKVKELEKRIEELESSVNTLKEVNRFKQHMEFLKSRIPIGMNFVASSGAEFEKHVLNKYSSNTYKEKGFPKEFEKIDLKNILKTANEKGNRVEKFKYWSKLRHEIRVVLGEKYYDDYWMELIAIAEYAWEYFQNHTLQYIIDKEKYLDEGGRPEEYDKEYIIRRFNEIEPKRGEIAQAYLEIADEIGVPEYLSDRTKRISQIVLEAKREKRK